MIISAMLMGNSALISVGIIGIRSANVKPRLNLPARRAPRPDPHPTPKPPHHDTSPGPLPAKETIDYIKLKYSLLSRVIFRPLDAGEGWRDDIGPAGWGLAA